MGVDETLRCLYCLLPCGIQLENKKLDPLDHEPTEIKEPEGTKIEAKKLEPIDPKIKPEIS